MVALRSVYCARACGFRGGGSGRVADNNSVSVNKTSKPYKIEISGKRPRPRMFYMDHSQ